MRLDYKHEFCLYYILAGYGIPCNCACKLKIGKYCGCYFSYEGQHLEKDAKPVLACSWERKCIKSRTARRISQFDQDVLKALHGE